MVHSGATVHLGIPAALMFIAIGILAQLKMGRSRRYWVRLLFAVFLSLGISMSKLWASFSFLRHFSRALYPIPGFKSLADTIMGVFQAVFFFPNASSFMSRLTNYKWSLGQHEWEYGVGLFPLIVFLVYSACLMVDAPERKKLYQKAKDSGWAIAGLIILLLIPIILNVHIAPLGDLIKTIPILSSHSRFIHWFSIYIPIFIIASLILVERMPRRKYLKTTVVILGIGVTASGVLLHPNSFYHGQSYGAKFIDQKWKQVEAGHAVRLERLEVVYGEAALTRNASSLRCYEAIFGYNLEDFPGGELEIGEIMKLVDGHYNFNDPTCFIYPKENQCRPGDRFAVSQTELLEKFRSFEAFSFKMSFAQRVSNIISFIFISVLLIFLFLGGICSLMLKKA
jgi:hypothetical protein